MEFEEWWDKQSITKSKAPNALILAFKEIAYNAWDAAISCPYCGKDMRQICRYCPPHDIEKYYKED